MFKAADDEGASLIKACVEGDKEGEVGVMEDLATKIDINEVAMNKTRSVDNDHGEIFSTLVPKTWAVASGNQHETQEMESGDEELKVEADTCDE